MDFSHDLLVFKEALSSNIVAVDAANGRIYVGKQKLYSIGIIGRGTRVALTDLRPSFKTENIIEACEKFTSYGKPKTIKTDNHRCFRSKKFNSWLERNKIQHRYIEKKSPWQNGYIESFFRTMETEFLREHFFKTIHEASMMTEQFVNDYNNTRYHTVIQCTPIARFNSTEDNDMVDLSKICSVINMFYLVFGRAEKVKSSLPRL